MIYNRTTWENSPSISTPINAQNLNKIEQGITDAANEINAISHEEWEDITSSLVIASGFTLADGKLYKKGKQIIGGLTIQISTSSYATGNLYEIATLPYAPLYDIYLPCVFSTRLDNFNYNGYMKIEINKNISVQCNSANSKYAKMQINYITTD